MKVKFKSAYTSLNIAFAYEVKGEPIRVYHEDEDDYLLCYDLEELGYVPVFLLEPIDENRN